MGNIQEAISLKLCNLGSKVKNRLQNTWLAHKGWVIVIFFGITALCFMAVCSTCRIRSSLSPFWITELGVCKRIGPDGRPSGVTDTFSSDSERIYAFFTLYSRIPVRLKVRWYYQDQFLFEQENLYQPGLNYSWITNQSGFKEGTYKVEVGGQTIGFKIEKQREDHVLRLFDDLNL
jgi:hypothetical protein